MAAEVNPAEPAQAVGTDDRALPFQVEALDVRGRECGRIYATAVMLLALEVVWRKEYRDR